jgi:hypothetical protein
VVIYAAGCVVIAPRGRGVASLIAPLAMVLAAVQLGVSGLMLWVEGTDFGPTLEAPDLPGVVVTAVRAWTLLLPLLVLLLAGRFAPLRPLTVIIMLVAPWAASAGLFSLGQQWSLFEGPVLPHEFGWAQQPIALPGLQSWMLLPALGCVSPAVGWYESSARIEPWRWPVALALQLAVAAVCLVAAHAAIARRRAGGR